jgi:hypothetical protein
MGSVPVAYRSPGRCAVVGCRTDVWMCAPASALCLRHRDEWRAVRGSARGRQAVRLYRAFVVGCAPDELLLGPARGRR